MRMQAELIWLKNTRKGLETNGRTMFVPPQRRRRTVAPSLRVKQQHLFHLLLCLNSFSHDFYKHLLIYSFPPGAALFDRPAWALRGATSHFPRSKHYPSSPVALYGWCHGVVLAPTENPYLVINQPHHLLFVFLSLCTWCSKFALLLSSKREKYWNYFFWPLTQKSDMHLAPERQGMHKTCIPSMLYFEATAELWPESQSGKCWECCQAPAWHGWSPGRDEAASLYGQMLGKGDHLCFHRVVRIAWLRRSCQPLHYCIRTFFWNIKSSNLNDQNHPKWTLSFHSQQCQFYFEYNIFMQASKSWIVWA